jgi:hypothetical protein
MAQNTDGLLSLLDIRANSKVAEASGPIGRGARALWLGSSPYCASFGQNKLHQREVIVKLAILFNEFKGYFATRYCCLTVGT